MPAFSVTRAHVLKACEDHHADLLDKLLEMDASRIDDDGLFTDTWGSWWGMLLYAILGGWTDGVRVLLHHGADRNAEVWGDGATITAKEAAAEKPEKPEILALLENPERPDYIRRTDPPLPEGLTAHDEAVNRQGEIADRAGLVFPIPPPE